MELNRDFLTYSSGSWTHNENWGKMSWTKSDIGTDLYGQRGFNFTCQYKKLSLKIDIPLHLTQKRDFKCQDTMRFVKVASGLMPSTWLHGGEGCKVTRLVFPKNPFPFTYEVTQCNVFSKNRKSTIKHNFPNYYYLWRYLLNKIQQWELFLTFIYTF